MFDEVVDVEEVMVEGEETAVFFDYTEVNESGEVIAFIGAVDEFSETLTNIESLLYTLTVMMLIFAVFGCAKSLYKYFSGFF